jgi:hypothetical protein
LRCAKYEVYPSPGSRIEQQEVAMDRPQIDDRTMDKLTDQLVDIMETEPGGWSASITLHVDKDTGEINVYPNPFVPPEQ